MLRLFVSLAVIAVFAASAHGSTCQPKLTKFQAIRVAQAAFEKSHPKGAAGYYTWTAAFRDCTWFVAGRTPPQALGGDARVTVHARSGKAVVFPIMRTDPRKIEAKRRQRI